MCAFQRYFSKCHRRRCQKTGEAGNGNRLSLADLPDFDTNFTFGTPQTHTGEMWMIPFREHTVHANEQLKDS